MFLFFSFSYCEVYPSHRKPMQGKKKCHTPKRVQEYGTIADYGHYNVVMGRNDSLCASHIGQKKTATFFIKIRKKGYGFVA